MSDESLRVTQHSSLIAQHCVGGSASFFSPPILERETRPVFLRDFHPVFTDLARYQGDLAESEVHVIVGIGACDVAVR